MTMTLTMTVTVTVTVTVTMTVAMTVTVMLGWRSSDVPTTDSAVCMQSYKHPGTCPSPWLTHASLVLPVRFALFPVGLPARLLARGAAVRGRNRAGTALQEASHSHVCSRLAARHTYLFFP
jgi:hypothetical protein